MYVVVLKPSAAKALAKLPAHIQARFARCVPLLEAEPRGPRPGLDVRPLRGSQAFWRLRLGDVRGIYLIEGTVVRFVDFAPRRRAYRV